MTIGTFRSKTSKMLSLRIVRVVISESRELREKAIKFTRVESELLQQTHLQPIYLQSQRQSVHQSTKIKAISSSNNTSIAQYFIIQGKELIESYLSDAKTLKFRKENVKKLKMTVYWQSCQECFHNSAFLSKNEYLQMQMCIKDDQTSRNDIISKEITQSFYYFIHHLMPKNMNTRNKQQHYHQDSEQFSQENSNLERFKHYEPLGLTPDQLQARLQSLKNYSTYQHTKNQRVNIAALTQSEEAPIVSTALDYGSRSGKNEVLPDYISTEDSGQQANVVGKFEALLISSPVKRQKLSQSSDPSFIKYKTLQQKKRVKVFSMINSSNSSQPRERYITETNPSQFNSKQKSMPVPKELQKLKNRLSLLPALRKQSNIITQQSKQPDLEENKTLSINQSQTNDINFITGQNSPQSNVKVETNIKNAFSKRYRRQEYLKEMKQILHKSKTEIDDMTQEQRQSDSIGMSRNEALKGLSKNKMDFTGRKKSKKIQYWPNYVQYSLPKKEEQRVEKIKEHFYAFNIQKAGVPPQVRELQQMIKQQITWQQSSINKDLISKEKDMLGHKFEYLFQLQQQNYKRNVKELIKCKKEYTIQKQREEIRANGIKRMKAIGMQVNHKQTQKNTIAVESD